MRKNLILLSAHSFSEGIMFNSSSKPNYTTLVTIDEYQNIKVQCLPRKTAEKYEKEKNEEKSKKKEKKRKSKDAYSKIQKDKIIFSIIVVSIMLPLYIPYILFDSLTAGKLIVEFFLSIMRFLSSLITLKFLLIAFLIFLIIIILSAFFDTYLDNNARQFHAAEHMIINSYSKLHRVPSIEELSQYSRFSINCGSNDMFSVLITCIVTLLCVIFEFNSNLYLILILIILGFYGSCLISFIQFFTTKPPTERELKIAIIGLTAWIENEEKFEEQ